MKFLNSINLYIYFRHYFIRYYTIKLWLYKIEPNEKSNFASKIAIRARRSSTRTIKQKIFEKMAARWFSDFEKNFPALNPVHIGHFFKIIINQIKHKTSSIIFACLFIYLAVDFTDISAKKVGQESGAELKFEKS